MTNTEKVLSGANQLRLAAARLRKRLIVLLLLMSLILLAAYLTGDRAFANRTDSTAAVTLAGEQRLHSQQIVLAAGGYVTTESPAFRQRLVAAIQDFETEHDLLTHDRSVTLGPMSPALDQLFDDGGLSQHIHEFVEDAQGIAAWSPPAEPPMAALGRLDDASVGPLLALLDRAVLLEEETADREIVDMRRQSRVLNAAAVLALLGLGVLTLQPLAKAMASTAEILEEQERLAGERRRWQKGFIAIANHELRTPITITSGMGRLLRDHWDELGECRRQELVQRLTLENDRMVALLDDLATVSGLTGESSPTQKVVVADLLADVCEPREAELECAAVAVDIDAERLTRLVKELVDNGFRHGLAPVTVTGRARGADLVIEVRDAGVGVDVADLEELLQPFRKGTAHESHGRFAGRGMGLAIAAIIVSQWGGQMTYESPEVGRNPGWRIELPGVVDAAGSQSLATLGALELHVQDTTLATEGAAARR